MFKLCVHCHCRRGFHCNVSLYYSRRSLLTNIFRHALPELDVAQMADSCTIESDSIRTSLSSISTQNIPVANTNEPSHPIDYSPSELAQLNFTTIIALRIQHQTRQAATGVRARTTNKAVGESELQQIAREFRKIVKEEEDASKRASTGLARDFRWKGAASSAPTGNTLNAKVVAAANSTKASSLHLVVFKH